MKNHRSKLLVGRRLIVKYGCAYSMTHLVTFLLCIPNQSKNSNSADLDSQIQDVSNKIQNYSTVQPTCKNG